MSIELYCAELPDSPETPCTPGISPTPSSPRITHTVTVRVLSLSTWSRSSVYNEQSDLVVACQLKSSRTFSSNITSSEQCIRKCMLKDDRSAKEGERIRNHFSYKPTLFHESKLPWATDAQICFSWPFKWCYCVDILLHGVNATHVVCLPGPLPSWLSKIGDVGGGKSEAVPVSIHNIFSPLTKIPHSRVAPWWASEWEGASLLADAEPASLTHGKNDTSNMDYKHTCR